jgi:hypothetical protein
MPGPVDFRNLYDQFNSPVTEQDCGLLCSPFNPSGKPFCCDICHAVPAAYRQEWEYLQANTFLWHVWKGTECPSDETPAEELWSATPDHMLLLACLGPDECQRRFRAISCRQFPFFPYITQGNRFIGLAAEWEYQEVCWVLNHLEKVTDLYRREFVQAYDQLFGLWEEEFDAYAHRSEELRLHFIHEKRQFPLLHRNGKYYLVHPGSERLEQVKPSAFLKSGFWRAG